MRVRSNPEKSLDGVEVWILVVGNAREFVEKFLVVLFRVNSVVNRANLFSSERKEPQHVRNALCL